ncbi:MAG TPA: inositol monophosphatase family protein [Anaerolineales bacterium]|nr:inositol monophosphatase family protein [Anaerolineales bacterium]|tara:strand:+ start:386 stop:1225 length:840 start_codon:yes stop_codon:yes gene_type:complete
MTPETTAPRSSALEHSTLPFAVKLARAAGKRLLDWFGNTEARTKEDGTTLTQADIAVDAFICAEIEANFPDDLIISEEMNHSHHKENADVWVIDPLDGSTNFSQGLSLWGVSIALLERGRPAVAVLYFPVLDMLCHACAGASAFEDGRTISARRPAEIARHSIFTCSAGAEQRYWPRLPAKRRTFGSTIYELSLVARGQALYSIVSEPKLWDLAAAWLLIEEAGGAIDTLDGSAPFPLTCAEDHSHPHFPLLAAASPELWQHVRASIMPEQGPRCRRGR